MPLYFIVECATESCTHAGTLGKILVNSTLNMYTYVYEDTCLLTCNCATWMLSCVVHLMSTIADFYSIVEFAGPDSPMVGDNIHLKCTVNVDPIVKIYGTIVRKNGVELRGTLTRDVRSNNTHVYTRSINNVDQSDGGTYECVIFSSKFWIQVKKELSLVVTNK